MFLFSLVVSALFPCAVNRPILHFRYRLICIDDFPRRTVDLTATPIAARAAQIAKADREQAENTRLSSVMRSERGRGISSEHRYSLK